MIHLSPFPTRFDVVNTEFSVFIYLVLIIILTRLIHALLKKADKVSAIQMNLDFKFCSLLWSFFYDFLKTKIIPHAKLIVLGKGNLIVNNSYHIYDFLFRHSS